MPQKFLETEADTQILTDTHTDDRMMYRVEFYVGKLTPCADFDEQINMKSRFHPNSNVKNVNVNVDTPQKPFTLFFPPHWKCLSEYCDISLYDLMLTKAQHIFQHGGNKKKLGLESITCFICR